MSALEVYSGGKNGELAGSATAVQMPNVACRMVWFSTPNSNTGDVYIGWNSNVTVPNGATDTTSGLEMKPGVTVGPIPVLNLNNLYYISDTTADDLVYFAAG